MQNIQGVTRQQWTAEMIENELRKYREIQCHANALQLDIEALKEYLELNERESILASALRTPAEPDMPRSSSTSDPTGRLAMGFPDVVDITRMKVELAGLNRRLRRVDAWLKAVSNRERIVLKMTYVDGMVWGEVITSYNAHPTDGIAREESTLRRWKRNALESIALLANHKMPAICTGNTHVMHG